MNKWILLMFITCFVSSTGKSQAFLGIDPEITFTKCYQEHINEMKSLNRKGTGNFNWNCSGDSSLLLSMVLTKKNSYTINFRIKTHQYISISREGRLINTVLGGVHYQITVDRKCRLKGLVAIHMKDKAVFAFNKDGSIKNKTDSSFSSDISQVVNKVFSIVNPLICLK